MNLTSNPMDDALGAIFSGTSSIFAIAFYVLFVIAAWRMFTKAGYPGILALIPIVNVIFLVKIAGYSGWLALLYIIPVVNIVLMIIVALKIGENFGKGALFSIFLLWLFPIIGYFIIGYGDARYVRRTA